MAFWLVVVGLPAALIGCIILGVFVAWWRVALVALSGLLALWVWAWYRDQTIHRFNSETWRTEAAKSCANRHRRNAMVNDLIEHHETRINSPGEAVQYLGPPDEKAGPFEAGVVDWRWGLGSGFGLGGCRYLIIGFAGDGYYGATTDGAGDYGD